jgi:hypothetical protein
VNIGGKWERDGEHSEEMRGVAKNRKEREIERRKEEGMNTQNWRDKNYDLDGENKGGMKRGECGYG